MSEPEVIHATGADENGRSATLSVERMLLSSLPPEETELRRPALGGVTARQGAEDGLQRLGRVVALGLGATVQDLADGREVPRSLGTLVRHGDQQDQGREQAPGRCRPVRTLALLVILHHELRDGVRRLLGLLVAPLGMEVENLLERVEPLAAIGVLRIEQEDAVATTGKFIARELYELVLHV